MMFATALRAAVSGAGRALAAAGRSIRGAASATSRRLTGKPRLSSVHTASPAKLDDFLSGMLNRKPNKPRRGPKRRRSLAKRLMSRIPKSRGRKQRVGMIDKAQAAADVAGIADQSGVTDLVNAGVSLGRGIASRSKAARMSHFKDAAIRAVSATPVVGDFAKLARVRRYGDIAHSMSTGRKATAANVSGKGHLARARDFISSMANSRPSNQPPAAATPRGMPERKPGLSASEKMSMMGSSRSEIDAADKKKRMEQDREQTEEKLVQRQGELVGTLGKMKKGFASLVVAIAMLPKVTEKWVSSLVDSRKQLASYNGTLAAANANLEVSRLRMDMRTANATAGSSAHVAEELKRLRENMQEFREMKVAITNIAATGFIWMSNAITEGAMSMAERVGLAKFIRNVEAWMGMNQQQQQQMPLHQAVEEMLKTLGQDRAGRRNNLPPL